MIICVCQLNKIVHIFALKTFLDITLCWNVSMIWHIGAYIWNPFVYMIYGIEMNKHNFVIRKGLWWKPCMCRRKLRALCQISLSAICYPKKLKNISFYHKNDDALNFIYVLNWLCSIWDCTILITNACIFLALTLLRVIRCNRWKPNNFNKNYFAFWNVYNHFFLLMLM